MREDGTYRLDAGGGGGNGAHSMPSGRDSDVPVRSDETYRSVGPCDDRSRAWCRPCARKGGKERGK